MKKIGLALLMLVPVAGCGGGEEAGGLTADERQRLENIADRLDEENAEVREILDDNGLAEAPPENSVQ